MKNIPVQNPTPNAEEWVNIITGKTQSNRVPLVEYLIDAVVMKPICEDMLGRTWVADGEGRSPRSLTAMPIPGADQKARAASPVLGSDREPHMVSHVGAPFRFT